MFCCVHAVRVFFWMALTNILFIEESMAFQMVFCCFFQLLYGISHGFDITHDLLVLA